MSSQGMRYRHFAQMYIFLLAGTAEYSPQPLRPDSGGGRSKCEIGHHGIGSDGVDDTVASRGLNQVLCVLKCLAFVIWIFLALFNRNNEAAWFRQAAGQSGLN